MPQQELLNRVVAVLEREGVPYMVTGSFVSGVQGEPRSTHDIDLVVVVTPTDIPALTAEFPAGRYHLDEQSAREAIARRDMFNLADNDTGDKVDFWLLTDEPFDQSRFGRRQRAPIGGVPMYMSRPEDTILQKLRWADMSGGSEKQFNDLKSVYELQFAVLDFDYFGQWIDPLGVRDLWDRLLAEAVPVRG